jgi:hypothetical protein
MVLTEAESSGLKHSKQHAAEDYRVALGSS